MKKLFLNTAFLISCVLLNAQEVKKTSSSCYLGIRINPNFSKATKLDSILKSYAPAILPGASIAVYSEAEGWWADAKGYANLEQKILMQDCHLQYIQSISKMYVAVEILQLKEQGKIELDAPMAKYLPEKFTRY